MEQANAHVRGRTVHPHPDVVARRVGDEVVLVQLERNQIFALNKTGARLWELVSGGATTDEAISRMLTEFDVSRPQLEEEVKSIVRLLISEELLVTEDA
jgi:hypothetical protein